MRSQVAVLEKRGRDRNLDDPVEIAQGKKKGRTTDALKDILNYGLESWPEIQFSFMVCFCVFTGFVGTHGKRAASKCPGFK